MLFSTASSLVGGYILRPVINSLVAEGKTVESRLTYLALILFVIGVVYLCGVVASYLQSRLMLSISLGATENLRNDLFDKVQNLPVKVFDGDGCVWGVLRRVGYNMEEVRTVFPQFTDNYATECKEHFYICIRESDDAYTDLEGNPVNDLVYESI